MRHSVARLMRGSDSHTSKLVKRGGNSAEVSGGFYIQVSEGKSINSKVLMKKLVDVCRCLFFFFVGWVSKKCD